MVVVYVRSYRQADGQTNRLAIENAYVLVLILLFVFILCLIIRVGSFLVFVVAITTGEGLCRIVHCIGIYGTEVDSLLLNSV